MPVDPQLQKWVDEKLLSGLSPEAAQQLKAHLGKEEIAQEWNRAVMAPSAVSQRMDQLAAEKAQYESNYRTEVENLQRWREEQNRKITQEVADRDAWWQAQLAAKSQAEGVDLTIQPPSPKTPTNGNGSGPKYLTQEDVDARLRQKEQEFINFSVIQSRILAQHQQLFGSIPDMEKVTNLAISQGKSLDQAWNEVYNVPGKRQELQEADIARRIKEGVDKEIAQRMTSQAMGQEVLRPNAPRSPIHHMIENARKVQPEGTEPLIAPAPALQKSQAVLDAEEAAFDGRYKVSYGNRP